MKIEKLNPGMVVYDVGRSKMGNTTFTTISTWVVKIVSVDLSNQTVVAIWNGNKEKTYYRNTWSKWKEKRPLLIRTAMGSHRRATREEIVLAKQKAEAK